MKKVHVFCLISFLLLTVIFCIGCSGTMEPSPEEKNSGSSKKEDTAIDFENDPIYTIHFDAGFNYSYTDGDKEAQPSYISIKKPDTTVKKLPEPPTRKGYEFKGWYTQPNGEGSEFTADTEVTDNITVYAKWEEIIVNNSTEAVALLKEWLRIIYTDDDNANYVTQNINLISGEVDSGYYGEFVHISWNSDRQDIISNDGVVTRPLYTDGNIKVTLTATLTKGDVIDKKEFILTVISNDPDSYIVNFDSQYADIDAYPDYIRITRPETTLVELPNAPKREDYEFKGWFTKPNGEGIEFTIDTVINKDIIVYAKWAPYYSVSFHGPEELCLPETQKIVEGNLAEEPQTPDYYGYHFDGWYSDLNYTNPFDFSKPISANTEIYMKLINCYTVHFGNTDSYVKVLEGECVSEPEDPYIHGFIFQYWEKDSGPYDFSKPVTSSMTLWPKYEAAPSYLVVFSYGDINGNIEYWPKNQTIIEGDSALEPEIPVVPGFIFEGWYRDSANTIPFDFSTPITSSVYLHAKWTNNYSNISIELDQISNISILREENDDSISFITDFGYDSYIWKVDGTVQTEQSNVLSFEKSSLIAGTHTILVTARKGNKLTSATVYMYVSESLFIWVEE